MPKSSYDLLEITRFVQIVVTWQQEKVYLMKAVFGEAILNAHSQDGFADIFLHGRQMGLESLRNLEAYPII